MSETEGLREAIARAVYEAFDAHDELIEGGGQWMDLHEFVADAVLALPQVAELWGKGPGPWCYDCGLPYGEPGWCDVHIPNATWASISPTGDGGGLLCLTCIARRLVEAGIEDTPLEVMSGPWDWTEMATAQIRSDAFEHGKRVGHEEAEDQASALADKWERLEANVRGTRKGAITDLRASIERRGLS